MKELTQEQYAAIGRQKHTASVASELREQIHSVIDEVKFQFGISGSSNIECLDEAMIALERASKLMPEFKAALIEHNNAEKHLEMVSGR